MKYQIMGGGWPIGSWLIPAGTIIDDPDGKAEDKLSGWERLAKGRVPPPDAIALDDEAYAVMVKEYETGRRKTGRRVLRGPKEGDAP
jgi:hypothetical protein